MNKEYIIKKVKSLGFPKGSYIVFGSCPMAIAGLRESNDIDMLVTSEIYNKMKNVGWKVMENCIKSSKRYRRPKIDKRLSVNFNKRSKLILNLLFLQIAVNSVNKF